jgi:uncharacterized membrane protein HdeD (DUF308 family)
MTKPKRVLGLVGAVAGVGVPAGSFFSSYPPPLFPGVTFITAGLSVAIWAMSSKGSEEKRKAKKRIIPAVLLLTVYIVLLQFTTLRIPPDKEKRVQTGFGTANWSLTESGKAWKQKFPEMTAEEMASREAAFVPERVSILWQTWSVYVSGILLIALYLLGFALWTSGFAILGIGGPDDPKKIDAGGSSA